MTSSAKRSDGRRHDQLRPVDIVRGYTRVAPGSVLVRMGDTVVFCTATVEESVPKWREEQNLGWVTAEYDMLPGSTGSRRPRRRPPDGRASEIQRLIGRTMRSIINMARLGPRTIWLDCDVLQADGGTRTAAVNGAYVALVDAIRWLLQQKLLSKSPIIEPVAAISVGKVNGRFLLDLNYSEDVRAEVDFNVAMTASGKLVEVQGTAEGGVFTRVELDHMVTIAAGGIKRIIAIQKKVLGGSGR